MRAHTQGGDDEFMAPSAKRGKGAASGSVMDIDAAYMYRPKTRETREVGGAEGVGGEW